MKITLNSPVFTPKQNIHTTRNPQNQISLSVGGEQLSSFPKAYIPLRVSFSSDSLAERRRLEYERQIQKDKNDYLWAMGWNPSAAKEEYKMLAKNEIAVREKEAFAYLKKSTKNGIKHKYENKYKAKEALYDQVMKNLDYYKKLFEGDTKTRKCTAAEIMQSTRGTLDSRISGYEFLKRDMKSVFVLPVTQEMLEGGEQNVMNGILLCGPTGCGKTAAAEAIAKETYCFCDRIKTDIKPDQFPAMLKNKRNEAINRYYRKAQEIEKLKNSAQYNNMSQEEKNEALRKAGSPRTVIIIDEFDRYFNPLTCSESVIRTNTDAVKNLFDGCAKLPSENDPNAAAVTFICTSNYPQRIPLSEINLNKLTPYGVLPPAGKDFEEVLRFYLNKANILIYENKKDDPSLQSIDTKNIKLEKFAKKFGPSPEDGAFSNDAIRYLVTNAVESYIDNPKFDFNIYLIREFKYGMRDIRPEKLERYLEQLDNLGLTEENTGPEIDYENDSRISVLEQKIEYLTAFGEDFLMPEQQEELARLREELEQLKKENE